MAKAWWLDPSWDPMQDLENCKESIGMMAPAVRQHSDVISELIKQNNALTDIVHQDRLEIAMLTHEVLRLRQRVENSSH
jgi:hypothetical protein